MVVATGVERPESRPAAARGSSVPIAARDDGDAGEGDDLGARTVGEAGVRERSALIV